MKTRPELTHDEQRIVTIIYGKYIDTYEPVKTPYIAHYMNLCSRQMLRRLNVMKDKGYIVRVDQRKGWKIVKEKVF